ncbi:MAG: sigma-70 family RNA polymerase sigma factor [Actinomycetota bacterium]
MTADLSLTQRVPESACGESRTTGSRALGVPEHGSASVARAAFAASYRRHLGPVTAYVARRRAHDQVADIVSETFVVAWRRWPDVPSEPATRPWLIGVARNLMANEDRRRYRQDRLVQAVAGHLVVMVDHLQPEQPYETRSWLVEALKTLPADDVELVLGTTWDGLSHAEMATVLGISPQAARQRLRRARRRLRRALAATEEL